MSLAENLMNLGYRLEAKLGLWYVYDWEKFEAYEEDYREAVEKIRKFNSVAEKVKESKYPSFYLELEDESGPFIMARYISPEGDLEECAELRFGLETGWDLKYDRKEFLVFDAKDLVLVRD